MKELDDLITYIENDLIGEHKDIKIIDEAIKKYAELYHKKQLDLLSVTPSFSCDEINRLRQYFNAWHDMRADEHLEKEDWQLGYKLHNLIDFPIQKSLRENGG